jgi:RNA polymerase sigma-70 factor (ECF subfamily)
MLELNKKTENVSDLKDEELLILSKKNPRLFEILVNRYKEAFLRKTSAIFYSVSGSSDHEDVVQDVFVKIFLNADKFENRGEGSFKAWAYRILFNTTMTALNKNSAVKKIPIDDILELGEENVELYEESEVENKFSLDTALYLLSKLPRKLQKTARMYFMEEKDYKEIAEAEDSTEGAIRVRVHRAKEAMREIAKEFN